MKEILKNLFDKYNIKYNQDMLDKFNIYYEYTIKTNDQFNLTAITEKYQFATKHFLDCCLAEKFLSQNATIVDVGAGAGFPSIPLKIIRPDLNFVLIDSLNKRVNFLNDVIKLLNLTNIKAEHFRAEDYAKNNREKFDVSIARAVANMSTLAEYCLPLTKVGGSFIALKGSSVDEEIEQSKQALNLLGAGDVKVNSFDVPEIEGERNIVVVQKQKSSPAKYPRGKNQPRVNPLR